jgi:predicted nuclease of predicted toxin-antitoxin system
MALMKFYLDTHIDKQVAIQLRQRGIEVVRCQDVALDDASDEEHLVYATDHELTLVSKDADFLDIHFEWLQANKAHCGIFLCRDRQSAAIGKIVTVCYDYYQLVKEDVASLDEIYKQVFEIA